MKLIIGLGNPGKKYKKTRHNLGFIIVDRLLNYLKDSGYQFSDFTFDKNLISEISEGKIKGEKIILIKPQTYMNNSGKAVKKFVDFYKLNPEKDILVIYDDIDLPFGKIRSRGESAAGHKGMESVINLLGTKKIPRIRCGILGKPKKEIKDVAKYVLEKFESEELKKIDQIFKMTIPLIEEFINKK